MSISPRIQPPKNQNSGVLPVRDEEAAEAEAVPTAAAADAAVDTTGTKATGKKKGAKKPIPARVTWGQSPLVRTLLRLFHRPLLWTGVLKLALSLVQFAPPLIISRLLRVLEAGGACVRLCMVVCGY